MEFWYALQAKPRKERQVEFYLRGRGIETFLPVLMVPSKRHPDGQREEPFFARYLFVHLDLTQVPQSSINWAPGVTGLVSFGGQPAMVRDEFIAAIVERLAQREMWDARQGVPLRPNDRVRVRYGPLRGLEGIFDRKLSPKGRARILIEMLRQQAPCEIDIECLERV